MKNFIYLSLLFLFFISCNKDIPKDIPDWLKDEIKHCKKKGNCCYESGQPFTVYEYKNASDNAILYVFKKYQGTCDEFYDYDGNFLCNYNSGACSGILFCGDIDVKNLVYVKTIWENDEKKNCY